MFNRKFTNTQPAPSHPRRTLSPFLQLAPLTKHSLASQVYKKYSEWPQPPSIVFSPEEAASLDESHMWSPYPFQTPIFASNTYKIARFRGKLADLVNETAALSLKLRDSTPTEDSWTRGCEIYWKLLQWDQELPPEILQGRNSTPHNLCLRCVFPYPTRMTRFAKSLAECTTIVQ
jgi:hypothetical protein